MYENKLEFPGGGGVQNKKPSLGGVWIFSGTAQSWLDLPTIEILVGIALLMYTR